MYNAMVKSRIHAPLYAFVVFVFVLVLDWDLSEGLPVTSCPQYKGNFYIADHLNACTYYWCLGGKQLGGPLRCPLGTGVAPFHRSNKSPCRTSVRTCSRFGPPSGGLDPSTPPPTTRLTTEKPLDNDQPTSEDLSPDVTTEGVMTTDDVDSQTTEVMTTEETTDDPGSGEIDELMPPGGGGGGGSSGGSSGGAGGSGFAVLDDTAVAGGVKISGAGDLAACLQVCSLLSGVCAGIDFQLAAPGSCFIHVESTECAPMSQQVGSIHIRLINC